VVGALLLVVAGDGTVAAGNAGNIMNAASTVSIRPRCTSPTGDLTSGALQLRRPRWTPRRPRWRAAANFSPAWHNDHINVKKKKEEEEGAFIVAYSKSK
jgi:hypothetical protein